MRRHDIQWLDFEAFNRVHATEHFLVTGASGSGKTTIINNMMATVLRKGAAARALVYDPKQELIPLVDALRGISRSEVAPFSSEVHILNPFDARASAWNMAEDIDNAVSARQLATILIPEGGAETGSSSFFTDATRDLLTGVLVAFIECVPNPKVWTFRDVILTMLYEPYLRFILNQTTIRGSEKRLPFLWRLQETYLGKDADSRTVGNIKASISTRLSIYEPIAAAWHRSAPKPSSPGMFSLVNWMKSADGILVLGNDEAARAALDPLNHALFKRVTELSLSRGEQSPEEKVSGENQTWFFLDEVREAGELDGLSRLLTKGRSKGACIVLGFQDIDGLRDVYGEEVASELCAQCNNVAVLRLNSPATAQWASDMFGRRLAVVRSTDRSIQAGREAGTSRSHGVAHEERPYLYTDAFLNQPTPKQLGAVAGFVRGPDTNLAGKEPAALLEELSFRVTQETKIPRRSDPWQGAFCPRPPADYLLEPWTSEDAQRLGLAVPILDWSNTEEAPKQRGSGVLRNLLHRRPFSQDPEPGD